MTATRTELPVTPPPVAARPRPPGRLVQSLLLSAPGAAALGAGAGLGIRYAQKTGLSWTAVVGIAGMLLGVVLLVQAVRGLWRSVRGWLRLMMVPLVVTALAVASSIGLAVAYTQVPPTALGDRTPSDLGLRFEDVTLTTSDGVQLSAWSIPSRNGAAVVLLHGAGSSRTSVLPHAAVLARNGFGVLMLDARGHGRSDGRGMDLGWYGDEDVAAGVSYLGEELGHAPQRIGLVGLSMGGEEAIGAAPHVDVRAVVAEGATARTAEDKDAWLPGGVRGAVQRGLDRLTYALTDLLTPAGRPTALRTAVADAEGTRFLLFAAADVPDEAPAAEVLREAAPARVDVWTVPASGHTDGLDVDPAGWEQWVVGFLERELR